MTNKPATLLFLVLAIAVSPLAAQSGTDTAKPMPPQARVIKLELGGKDYLPILRGAPESHGMRSGLVELAPGRNVGKHSTHDNEELLIVLAGRGEMRFGNGTSLPVEAGYALYCPPRTEHDVFNTGSEPLRYVYVVSPVR